MYCSNWLNGYLDTEKGISHDKNGNIKTLVRAGAAVDNLSYGYTGNRLSSVTDGSGSNLGVKNGSSSFAYDDNGNMTSDGNRGATLTYNYLNLPKTIKIGAKTFTYDYDAAGTKHKYAGDTLTLKYAGAFEYRQVGAANQLYRVGLREGQAVFRDGKLRFEYSLKDHLGNVRVVFDGYGQVLQKTDYYAFGLEIDRNVPVKPMAARNGVNRYNFLGKETQVAIGYIDLSRRFYDPTIGRFMQVDPVTEGQEDQSTFQYGWNNPILRSDPNGDCPLCGLAIGAAVDYSFQVAGNLAVGKSFTESLTDVDGKSILISGLAGAATSGFSAFGGRAAQFAIGTGIDAAESAVKQVNIGGVESVTVSQTVSDVVSNKVAGVLTKGLDNVVNTNVLSREAYRTARVSANDPSSTGRAAKAESAQGKLNTAQKVNATTGQVASGVVGMEFKIHQTV